MMMLKFKIMMLYDAKDPNTKWKPAHIIDVMPNQSYLIELEDGRQFRRNEHQVSSSEGMNTI